MFIYIGHRLHLAAPKILGKPQPWSRCLPKPIPVAGKARASAYQTSSNEAIPERLLVYHAGPGKIALLGMLKLTTLFIFSTSLVFIAPHFYQSQDQPLWVVPAVVAGGAVPFLYMTYYSAPFVTYVHIRLPVFARRSKEQLLRWSQHVAPDTEVEMTTIKSYGSLRTSRMRISELRPTKAFFGIQNLLRVPRPSSKQKKPWWAAKDQSLFFVGKDRRKTIEAAVWQKVLSQIRKG